MKNSLSKFAALLAVGFGALASAPSALAVSTLTLDDGPGGLAPLIIVDGGAGDSFAGVPGTIAFVGSYGVFTINVTSGVSKPSIGSAANPQLSLDTQSVSSGAGTLYIQFSDDDFGPLSPSLNFGVDASVTSLAPGGSVTWSTYGDSANAINGNDGIHAQSSFSTASTPFSTSVLAPTGGPIGFPYSLTAQMVITHTAAGTSNPDMVLASVPEGGSTAVMLGIAMLGFCKLNALRKKRALK
jgi:hypothetical protein